MSKTQHEPAERRALSPEATEALTKVGAGAVASQVLGLAQQVAALDQACIDAAIEALDLDLQAAVAKGIPEADLAGGRLSRQQMTAVRDLRRTLGKANEAAATRATLLGATR